MLVQPSLYPHSSPSPPPSHHPSPTVRSERSCRYRDSACLRCSAASLLDWRIDVVQHSLAVHQRKRTLFPSEQRSL
jgi:hypothetical protein